MAKKTISVEILIYALCNTLSEIAKADKRIFGIIENWDKKIQFNVEPDGPSAYLVIENGRIIFYRGEVISPDLYISFSSTKSAYNFFIRKSPLLLLDIFLKNIRHPILFLQTMRLLLFAGEYLTPSVRTETVIREV